MKKTLALRAIQDEIASGSVASETILESLEIIEQLDQKQRIKILDSMKLAYCAVAVECTVKHMWVVGSKRKRDPETFFEAVKTIWRERVEKLEFLKKSELVTDELREFKEEMEAALWDSNACERLLERAMRNEALRLVMDYLREALDEMGPPLLELLARTEKEREEEEKDADNVGEKASREPDGGVADGSAKMETQSNDMFHTVNNLKGPGVIMDSEKVGVDIPTYKYDNLPTPEVNRAKEALKSSSMELKALLNDPLPNALNFSESLMPERQALNKEILVEDQVGKRVDVPNPSVDVVVPVEIPNPSVTQAIEPIQTMKNSAGIPIYNHQNVAPKRSLMEYNSTARTYEWDDSIDGSPEDASGMSRFNLDKPRTKVVSPLKEYKIPKFAGRRKFKRWSVEEEDALREGVKMFGRGSWKAILDFKRDIFDDRTEVDLKDKWRNMTK